VTIIEIGDRRVVSIIKKKISPDKYYCLSNYTFLYSDDRTHLLRNTLTGMTAALSDAEWACMKIARKQPINGAELMDAGLEELVWYCFLVVKDTDDYKLYELAVSVLKNMSREEKGTKAYTILSTTGCNARCAYCYEEGMPVQTMSEETADCVADFIEKTRWQNMIKLIWFGGEPLAGSRIISRICNRLNEKNVPFRSKLVTNATLLTPKLLDEAVELWHLDSAQVSVDGKREDYEARKRYVDPSAHHYDAMIHAVGIMLERGLKVTLRCNYDGDNQEGLTEFFDDVKARFGCPDNLSVYPAILFQAHADESCIDLYRKKQMLNAYLRELGLKKEDKINQPHKLKLNLCGADSGDKCVVIAPDGKLYHCEHLPGNTSFGSVFDLQTSIYSDERANLSADERCRTCSFLPECTPFFRNGCPDFFDRCRAFRKIETDEAMRRLILNLGAAQIPDGAGYAV
jgi:radical SAM protein with 4Fe4S-binding SPASM domain